MFAYAAEAQPASPAHGGTAHIQPLPAILKTPARWLYRERRILFLEEPLKNKHEIQRRAENLFGNLKRYFSRKHESIKTSKEDTEVHRNCILELKERTSKTH